MTDYLQIIGYSNRIEVRNPGQSPKSLEHLGEPGSVPRNPRIAAVLPDTRFAATKGSGIAATRHLRPLANAGVLAYTMPDMPNHLRQAYRAVTGMGETTRACHAVRRGSSGLSDLDGSSSLA
ncbi:MAG: hypothetical protein H7A18_14155 [Sinobacteraceae bacterium]|nr:hypothetical protein [Nevskiaceae bacterium]MCP5340503.1 hypothetical protein [Nevskiaceae bacterium]MCP5360187.1 hypothetical protein [Nevskiaceae bacterium]MCP5473192.1 hypothetical protein [Nevskiaceae bacterium]